MDRFVLRAIQVFKNGVWLCYKVYMEMVVAPKLLEHECYEHAPKGSFEFVTMTKLK